MIMKKLLMPLLATLFVGVMATSCEDEYIIESMNTKVGTVTVVDSDWTSFPGSNIEGRYLQAEIEWPVLTQTVLDWGNVNVYVYVGNKQYSLPYVCPVTYTMTDGSQVVVAENIKFYLLPGHVYIVMQDLDGEMPDGYIEPMTFRMVATWPVDYIIRDDK
jgi:hypothetical protein